MYRASRNSKFKLHQKRQDTSASIQEMSLSLLNEIDRKYETMSLDQPKKSQKVSLSNTRQRSKGSTSVSNYGTLDTQPSVDGVLSYQKLKQNRKLQEI